MSNDEAIVEFQGSGERRIAPVEERSTRAMAEVQASMVVAKRFPRDQNDAFARIMQACQRRSLAEVAMYAYPRGGQTVTGPSIRLAEAMAQAWGNIDFGIVELEQRKGESTMMAYAWDLETNTRQTKVFSVPHVRYKRSGPVPLEDPRDVYELTANQGARRMRACILGVIPGDVVEAAVARCEKTLASGSQEPLQDRAKKMVAAFVDLGVTRAQIEQRIGHRLETITEPELIGLRKIYTSIKDHMSAPAEFFRPLPPAGGAEITPEDVAPPEPEAEREPGEEG